MAKQIDKRSAVERDAERARQERAEKERRLNRKINFLVMREVWNITRGRAKKGMEINRTIYEVFGIRRERYSRAIDTGVIKLTKDELNQLVQLTGVEREIFEGTKCFQFDKVSRKEWEELFDLREGDVKTFNQAVKSLFDRTDKMDLKPGSNLYKLSMFFKYGISTDTVSVEDIVRQLEKVTFSLLDDCDAGVLEQYLKVLNNQVGMADSIARYKKMKNF